MAGLSGAIVGTALAADPAFAGNISTQASHRVSQWPETDASLSYIRRIGPKIERKTGMPFVAIDGTAITENDNPPPYFIYAKGKDPLSAAFKAWLDHYLAENLDDLGRGAISVVDKTDRIYLITEPKMHLMGHIAGSAPILLSSASKNFSWIKFIHPLNADDVVAFLNYHEVRHVFQDISQLPKEGLLSTSVPADSLKQALCNDNGFESEADSFAALKFISSATKPRDIPRRTEAVKAIAKLRLVDGVDSRNKPQVHDTYDTLAKTIQLIESAYNLNWHEVQAQFTEMYQRLNPDKPLSYNERVARVDTNLLRGLGGVEKLSDDRYIQLSDFLARAYAPTGDELLALTMHDMGMSIDPDVQSDLRQIQEKFGPPTPEGEAYVAAHLKLADAAMKSGYVEAPAPGPAPRPAMLGVR